ncbi:MAG TPA: PTS system mannose/fructose/sorbose family transporter subunit IID [Anaerolineaceae bacterium]|nr:PTS system mannose/fructose/sorbose family transporter subunit IID [Anaerolineaceae bacterium]
MTIWQALLISIFGYFSSIYSPWLIGLLGGWYTIGRPLVSGLIIGLILGDVQQGIIIGAAIQAMYIGLVTPGGSMPADVNFAAWIGIPLAIISGADASYAVSLSIALSFMGVMAVYATASFNSVFVHKMDRYITDGKLEKAMNIPVVGQITNFVCRFIPIFLANYLGAQFVPTMVSLIPEWLGGILTLLGSILPLVGFALLLQYVVKKKLDLIYYLIGFILVAVFKIQIIPVVLFGLLFAYMDLRYTQTDFSVLKKTKTEKTDDKKKLLSKKDVHSAYWNWMFWNLSVQNFERMEAPAIIRMLGKVKEKLYPGNKEAQKELLARHEAFFNTEPYIGSIVPGIVLGMEEQSAVNKEDSADLISGIKTALMGPFAGIGDSLYVGTLIPILLSIALGLSTDSGNVMGPVFYVISHLAIMLPLTWFLFKSGYSMGMESAQLVLSGGIKDKITQAMNIIGLVVVGAITSMYVNVKTGLTFTQGDMVIDLNQTLNGLFPNLITVLLGLATYYLMAEKKMKIGWLFLVFIAVAIVGYFTKVLAV